MAEVKAVANRGFSLVELLVVLGILSVIMSFAYPSYRDYIMRSSRSDAHIAIQRVAMAEERVYALQNKYTDAMASLGGADSSEGFYTIKAVTGVWNGSDCTGASSDPGNTNSYTILAIPVAGKSQENDAKCTCIYMDSRGVKGSTGDRDNPEDCWNVR